MHRTNIVLDEKLVRKVKKITGAKTTRDAVDRALREMAKREDFKKILELQGRVRWEGDLNAMRRGRTFK